MELELLLSKLKLDALALDSEIRATSFRHESEQTTNLFKLQMAVLDAIKQYRAQEERLGGTGGQMEAKQRNA